MHPFLTGLHLQAASSLGDERRERGRPHGVGLRGLRRLLGRAAKAPLWRLLHRHLAVPVSEDGGRLYEARTEPGEGIGFKEMNGSRSYWLPKGLQTGTFEMSFIKLGLPRLCITSLLRCLAGDGKFTSALPALPGHGQGGVLNCGSGPGLGLIERLLFRPRKWFLEDTVSLAPFFKVRNSSRCRRPGLPELSWRTLGVLGIEL